jgi:hypothetical protein
MTKQLDDVTGYILMTLTPANLVGWHWAPKAAEEGALAAAPDALPGDAEADAQECAVGMALDGSSALDWSREVARLAAQLAVDSYGTYIRLVTKFRKSQDFSARNRWRLDMAVADANQWGWYAAKTNRIFVLMKRELERSR